MNILELDCRIVVVTGDIYIMAKECTSTFTYKGDGQMAYCRSKLGINWLFYEFASRHPNYFMYLVHPGVINTTLASDNTGIDGYIKSWLCCSTKAGAQVSLICSAASTDALVNTGYYHNTCGLMLLDTSDPVNNQLASKVLYDEVENICRPFMQ